MEKQKEQVKEQKRANRIIKLFLQLQHYPYALGEKDKEKIESRIIKSYKKGDEKTKGMILFFINEKLSDSQHLREFINTKNSKDARSKILGDALSFYHSLDGQFFLLSLLEEFGDELSLKLLTHFTSKYLAQPSRFYNILAEKCIDLLGKSKNRYSLEFLLNLSSISSLDPTLHEVVMHNLFLWKEKIDLLKIPLNEKKRLKKRINEFLKTSHPPNYYS